MSEKGRSDLRSTEVYGKQDKDGFIHRSWMKNQGYPEDVFDGRPVIGICNTWSELTPCNAHFRTIADHVKRGVWEAGGLPLEFPAMSLGESQLRPTAMLFRNLLAMEVEESLRGNPIDGVVLLGGCDKTTPGQLMGAASVDLPSLVISSGPMLNGKFRGQDIGSGTDVWRFSEEVRAGTMSVREFMEAEAGMSRSAGTCMTMGSASTYACLFESMGLAFPYNGTIPAVDAQRMRMAHLSGRRIVEMVRNGERLSSFLTRQSFENAIKVLSAIGGSSNAVIHLLAIAGRVGVDLSLDDFDGLGAGVPLLVNLQPSGEYLMENFHYAGGVPALMEQIGSLIHLDLPSVAGGTIGEQISKAEVYDRKVIAPMDAPFADASGLWVLRGNLCPQGAIIKSSAASHDLLKITGKAVVFENVEDMKARVNDPELEVDENSILVLKGCGPKGYPGMAEVGNMPIPKKMLDQGVRDMVRISDARMSGTAYGTVVLHVSPEAEAGGPLAIVRTGDVIKLDAFARSLDLEISEEEITARLAEWPGPATAKDYPRGYAKLYIDTVLQADKGCDLDFLVGMSGSAVAREAH